MRNEKTLAFEIMADLRQKLQISVIVNIILTLAAGVMIWKRYKA